LTATPLPPWYTSAFDSDYLLRYAHRDRNEAEGLVEQLIAAAAIPTEGRVLDLCCGSGRHLLAMARRGVGVGGMDLSPSLLRAARALAREEEVECPCLVRGDMRQLPYAAGSFAGVTHFFTAFGYFDSDDENFGVFREVARILKPGGLYLFDFFNAELVRKGLRDATDKRLSPDGRRVEKHIVRNTREGVVDTIAESVRLFEPGELRAALEARDLCVEREWGDYGLADFDAGTSPRWMVLCRRR